MTTILAATDLSRRSNAVAARAVQLAQRLQARLVLVHVADENAADSDCIAAREKLAAEVAIELGIAGKVEVEIGVLRGKPEQVIPDLAAAADTVLLVMGLHRARRVFDVWRLTTMERILLHASCPVLIAHLPPTRRYARVLSATDFAPACARALEVAAMLAPDAAFRAIHALQLPLKERFNARRAENGRALTRAEALRDHFLAMPGLPPNLTLPEIVPGNLHEVVNFVIDEFVPDLMCVGTHSGRDPRVLGNYARDLMRAPPTDLLVAKPPREPDAVPQPAPEPLRRS